MVITIRGTSLEAVGRGEVEDRSILRLAFRLQGRHSLRGSHQPYCEVRGVELQIALLQSESRWRFRSAILILSLSGRRMQRHSEQDRRHASSNKFQSQSFHN